MYIFETKVSPLQKNLNSNLEFFIETNRTTSITIEDNHVGELMFINSIEIWTISVFGRS